MRILIDQGQREFPLSIPEEHADREATLTIYLEDGTSARIPIELRSIPVSERAAFDGRHFVRKRVPLAADLPLGYHELSIEIVGVSSTPARLIVCPSRAYRPAWLESAKTAGLAISLYGLRSARNWGCGDTSDLKALVDWVLERTGASFIALNPLHAIQNRQPFNTSPYLPNSIYYRNPIYLDIEQIAEFQCSARAQTVFRSDVIQTELAALREAELVEYERVYRMKRRFLKLLFRCFLPEWSRDTERARALRTYIEREGELLDRFAVYEALDEAIHRSCPDVWNWRSWPEPYQDPQSAAVEEFARKHWRSVLFHKYVQWQLDLQLAAAQTHACERGLTHRSVPRSGSGHGSVRFRSVGASRILCIRLPRGRAAGRFLAQGAGLGLSASQLRSPLSGRLPAFRRVDPQKLPARGRAAHRSCDAFFSPVLDSGWHGRGGRNLCARPSRRSARAFLRWRASAKK